MIERTARLFELVGFARVQAPPSLAEFTWLERSGTQVHPMPTEAPTVPPRTPGRCASSGTGPGGNRVELMAEAPS